MNRNIELNKKVKVKNIFLICTLWFLSSTFAFARVISDEEHIQAFLTVFEKYHLLESLAPESQWRQQVKDIITKSSSDTTLDDYNFLFIVDRVFKYQAWLDHFDQYINSRAYERDSWFIQLLLRDKNLLREHEVGNRKIALLRRILDGFKSSVEKGDGFPLTSSEEALFTLLIKSTEEIGEDILTDALEIWKLSF